MKTQSARRRYIEAACQIIEEQGVEGVSARRIAARTGTVPSAVYRHFRDMDELLAYASVRHMWRYYREMDAVSSGAPTRLEAYRRTEVCFARYCFSNPVLFDRLAIRTDAREYGRIVKDYLEIFAETTAGDRAYTRMIGHDFAGGNRLLLAQCVEEGSLAIPAAALDTVNAIIINTFKGYLKDALEGTGRDAAALAADYIRCFEYILSLYRVPC